MPQPGTWSSPPALPWQSRAQRIWPASLSHGVRQFTKGRCKSGSTFGTSTCTTTARPAPQAAREPSSSPLHKPSEPRSAHYSAPPLPTSSAPRSAERSHSRKLPELSHHGASSILCRVLIDRLHRRCLLQKDAKSLTPNSPLFPSQRFASTCWKYSSAASSLGRSLASAIALALYGKPPCSLHRRPCASSVCAPAAG